MSWGEVTRQNVRFIDSGTMNPTTLPINANPLAKCCSACPVFASSNPLDTDYYKNDRKGPIMFFSIALSVTMYLQKKQDDDSWADVDVLTNNNTYGVYEELRTRNNIKPFGYQLEFQKVLQAFGTGCYRVRWDYVVASITGDEYELMIYSADLADETVRLDFWRNSIIGTSDQKRIEDFVGLNWFDQVRVCNSFFGDPGGPFEKETHRLTGGFERPHQLDYKEEYSMTIKKASAEFHRFMRYSLLMSDIIEATDYNAVNFAGPFISVNVQINGEYRPNNFSPDMPVTFKLVDGYNNRRKLYS